MVRLIQMPKIVSNPPLDRAPLTGAQRYLWEKIQRSDHDDCAMNMPLPIMFRHGVNEKALRSTFQKIVDQLDILRTNFREEGGEIWQVIEKNRIFDLEVSEYTEGDPAEIARQWADDRKDFIKIEFDIFSDMLVRAKLFRFNKSESIVIFVLHHLIFDGYSGGILKSLIISTYAAILEGRDVDISPDLQYRDVAIWEKSITREMRKDNEEYWQSRIGDAAEVSFGNTKDISNVGRTCRFLSFHISARLRDALLKQACEKNCTLFAAFSAAFAALIASEFRADRFLVWFPCVQRNRLALTKIIGPLYVNLPIRVDLGEATEFQELMEKVQHNISSAIEHQWVDYADLARLAGRQQIGINMIESRSLSGEYRACDVPEPAYRIGKPDLKCHRHPSDLVLSLADGDGGVAAAFSYNVDYFSFDELANLAEQFCQILLRVVNSPSEDIFLDSALRDDQKRYLKNVF